MRYLILLLLVHAAWKITAQDVSALHQEFKI